MKYSLETTVSSEVVINGIIKIFESTITETFDLSDVSNSDFTRVHDAQLAYHRKAYTQWQED